MSFYFDSFKLEKKFYFDQFGNKRLLDFGYSQHDFVVILLSFSEGSSGNEEEEPSLKRRREEQRLVQSEEFQKILNAKSRHTALLQAVRALKSLLFCLILNLFC